MPNPYDKYSQAPNIEDLFPSQPTQRRQRRTIPLHVRKPVEPEVPETEEDLGWFRTYGPHVARGIGGLLGVTPVTGAAGGAGGEIVAQAIEQGDWTPDLIGEDNRIAKRIAAESAIGAMGGGFAKLLGAGLTSIPRALGAGAALGGAAPIVRHGFEEGEWDPTEYAGEVGTGAALGGAVGGGLAKLLGKTGLGKPAGPASRYEIETTAVPGGQVLKPGGKGTQYVNRVRVPPGKGDVIAMAPETPLSRVPYETGEELAPLAEDLSGVPYIGTPVTETAQQASARLRAEATQAKADLEKTKLAELQKLFAERGVVEPRLSEAVSAVDPVTGHRLGASFREVAEEGGEGGGGVLARQADEPVELASEMERIRQELAQTPPEAPIPPPVEAPAPTPLEEILGPQTPPKPRSSRPRKGKSERFNERAAAIAAQAESGVPPEAPRPQSLAELLGQVDPNRPPTTLTMPGEGVVSAPPGADPAEALAVLRSAGPEAPALPAAPETPQDLMQILRTHVGATGKNYRLAREAAKSGEIPSAAMAREAHLREQAALKAPKPAGTVPEVTPAQDPTVNPTSWIDDETREIERLSKLPPEQRLAAFLNREAGDPVTPPAGTVAPDAPVSPEPAWVAEEMRAIEEAPAAIAETPEESARIMQDLSDFLSRQRATEPVMPTEVPKTGRGKRAPDPMQPRLVKDPGERGAYPAALAARLGLGLAGAAVGGAVDPFDDPVLSALAGGAVGMSIPTMAQGLMKLGAAPEAIQSALQDLNLPDGAKRAAAKVGRILPQWQRASYLTDALGLPANAWVGPYGSGLFGALEKGLMGDPRGWAVAKELANPWNFFKEYPSAFQEARSLVGRAEGYSEAEAVGDLERGLTVVGTALTGGDVAIRRILVRNGFSDDEARIMTMTAEPFTKSGESLAHLRGFIPDMAFPFKRTPVNIAEQGLLRTPGLGFLQQGIGAARGTRQADPLLGQLGMQAAGAGVGYGSAQLSEELTPEQARILRRFVTNFAGPYSLLAGGGFAAGQAMRRGQPIAGTTVRNLAQQMPLPSIEPIQEALGTGAKLIDDPRSFRLSKDLPRGAFPTAIDPRRISRDWEAIKSFFTTRKLPPRRRRSER